MKIRFDVDQAECFRNGIDCPKSIFNLEIDPKDLSVEHRNLIANHLKGIDVCTNASIKLGMPVRVIAKFPTYDALIDAIKLDDQEPEKPTEVIHKGRCPQCGGDMSELRHMITKKTLDSLDLPECVDRETGVIDGALTIVLFTCVSCQYREAQRLLGNQLL